MWRCDAWEKAENDSITFVTDGFQRHITPSRRFRLQQYSNFLGNYLVCIPKTSSAFVWLKESPNVSANLGDRQAIQLLVTCEIVGVEMAWAHPTKNSQ